MEQLLKISEAAEMLRISKSQIYSMVSSQRIPHVRIGARILFKESRLDEWVSMQERGERNGMV